MLSDQEYLQVLACISLNGHLAGSKSKSISIYPFINMAGEINVYILLILLVLITNLSNHNSCLGGRFYVTNLFKLDYGMA